MRGGYMGTEPDRKPLRLLDRNPLVGLLALASLSMGWAQPRLLVFSGQPEGVYRHDAIDYGTKLMKTLAPKAGFAYDTSTDVNVFTDANLDKYQAVMMNCNCRHTRLFSQPQREALQRFVRRGGGWAGTHCAAAMDLDLDWPWYRNLVGAIHRHHTDGSQPGILRVDNRTHASMTHFTSSTWNILPKEELYFFLNDPAPSWRPNPVLAKVNVLLTFQSWGNGQTKPPAGDKADSSHLGAMSWYHEYDGGRAWYTGLGHENWIYQDSTFIKHVMGGLKYVLRMDGTSGLAASGDAGSADPLRGPRAFIGMDAGNPAAIAYRVRIRQGQRFYGILGNRE
ncbi:MAG: hypothetical protein JWP91_1407 [Fibrobacteres bacterium]|nr:hypothetical protein [Fibrobacterota bacterium]